MIKWRARFVIAALTVLLAGCVQPRITSEPTPAPTEVLLEDENAARLVTWTVRGNAALRALVIVPKAPRASVILFVGGTGRLGITDRGKLSDYQGNFLARSRMNFARGGLVTVLVDRPTDYSEGSSDGYRLSDAQAQDAALVIDYLRKRWNVPVAVVGTSRGTISAANIAVRLQTGGPDALVLSSSVTRTNKHGRPSVFQAGLEGVKVPTLVMHNQLDGCAVCPFADTARLVRSLPNVPRKELIVMSSESVGSDPCEAMSAHGYLGIEDQAVSAIHDWLIDPTRGPATEAR